MPIELPKYIKGRVESTIEDAKTFIFGDNSKKNLDITTYRTKFLGSNARAYLFICRIQFPGMQNALKSGIQTGLQGGISDISKIAKNALGTAVETGINVYGSGFGTEDFKYFIKSTFLPETSIEETSTHWCGQEYKMSSVRRSQDWNVTFLVNQDASILRKFWDWHLLMHNPETNTYGKPNEYMTDQVIQLLGIDGYPICTYTLYSAWPKTIGQVDLDYSNNEFATVDITFSYQYHTVTDQEESGILKTGRKAVRALGLEGLMK